STGMTKTGKIRRKKKTNSLDQPHIELAQALALAILPGHVASDQIATPDFVQEIWEALIAVERSFHFKRLSEVSSSSDRQQKATLYLQEHVRLNTQLVRNWGCFKYFREMLVKLYEPLDVLYKNEAGINATDLVKVFDYLVRRGDRIINKHWSCFRPVATAKSLKDAVKIYCETHPHPNESPSQILEKLTTLKVSLEEAKSILMGHADLSLPEKLFFTTQELVDNLGIDPSQIRSGLSKLSLVPGDLSGINPEYLFLDNPVWRKPVIKLAYDRYFCLLPQMFFNNAFDIFNELGISDKARVLISNRRAEFLEKEIATLMQSSFPEYPSFPNLKWADDAETDYLIKIDSVLIIVEAKSGSVSRPALRGKPERIRRDVKELIVEPAIQSQRLVNEIFSLKSRLNDDPKLTTIFPFDVRDIQKIIRLSVTIEDFASVQSNLAALRDAGLIDIDIKLAPTITLADLQIVLDILEPISVKVHYLARRNELEALKASLFAGEMDLLGLYLENGLNIDASLKEFSKMQLINMSKAIDEYYIALDYGVNPKKPFRKCTRWWIDILKSIQARVNDRWLETSLILLDVPVDEQVRIERNFKKLKKNVKKNWRDPNHMNSVVGILPRHGAHALVFFAFRQRHNDSRLKLIENLAVSVIAENNVSSCLVLAVNIDRPRYPYNLISVFDRREDS
ncbi:MAG: hypothetical protein WAK60_05020, partial [Sedimentisphaerales bacterium]